MWCGIANGAEDILLPERYDNDERALINHIIEGRKEAARNTILLLMLKVSDILQEWQEELKLQQVLRQELLF